MVVEIDPSGRQFSHLVQTVKDVHIENCLPICPVKPFDKSVLHRTAGFDELELDAVSLGPVGDGYAGELRPVIESDAFRQTSHLGDPIEHSQHSSAAQVEVDLDGQHLASVVVDHVEGAKPLPIAECVRHEIGRPAAVQSRRNRQRLRVPSWQTPLVFAALVELHLAVNTVHSLVVPLAAFSSEQVEELAESEIWMIRRQPAQRLDQCRVVPRLRLVPKHSSRQTHRLARSPLAQQMFTFQIPDRLTLLRRYQPFFSIRSLSARTSKLTSAYIRFSFAFSSSSSLKRLISAAVIPPYLDFQLKYVDSEIPFSRHTSATVRPVSTAFNIPSTCLSLNLLRFILSLLFNLISKAENSTYQW